MDARLLVMSKFMVSAEFGLGDIPREPLVTITEAKIEVQEEGQKKERWGLLYFAEPWAKPLKFNRTHQKALILMFGNDTSRWKGKRIGLYALEGEFFGKRQTAVRIRGSPDLQRECSFTVRKFGGGVDQYKLEVMKVGAHQAPAQQHAAASNGKGPYVPGTLGFGTHREVKLEQLTPEQIAEALLEAEALKAQQMKPEHAEHLQKLLAQLAAEQDRRFNGGAPQRQPGEDG